MALSEYMPYGAPELLAGSRSRMARATLAASLAVAMLVSGLGAILNRGGTTITLEPFAGPIVLLPPAELPKNYETPPPVQPAPPLSHELLTPVPVPDRVAPQDIPDTPSLPGAPGMQNGHDTAAPESHGVPMLPVEKDPEPGVFVPVDELPVAVQCAEAHYPDLPREAGVEGTVRVLMLVGLDGRVERAIIAPGGSVPMLDEAALAASRECVFTPALTNNHPVKVWVARNYRFSLH
jgi:protein TonB